MEVGGAVLGPPPRRGELMRPCDAFGRVVACHRLLLLLLPDDDDDDDDATVPRSSHVDHALLTPM